MGVTFFRQQLNVFWCNFNSVFTQSLNPSGNERQDKKSIVGSYEYLLTDVFLLLSDGNFSSLKFSLSTFFTRVGLDKRITWVCYFTLWNLFRVFLIPTLFFFVWNNHPGISKYILKRNLHLFWASPQLNMKKKIVWAHLKNH